MSDPDTAVVAAVVVHYEQHEALAHTLAALRAQTRPVDLVVVTDDGSATPPRLPDDVRLVTQPDQGFRAALARNRGIEAAVAAGAEVLVLLDADTTPEPGFVAAALAPVLADPSTLVVGRRRHRDPVTGSQLPEPAWLRDGYRRTDDLSTDGEDDFRFVISACLVASATWFQRVGGFEVAFDAYGGEDWELAHRWWVAGGRLRHVPEAVCWHEGPDAGARPLEALDTDARTAETLAVARRVSAPVAAFDGLWWGPPRVVVTHEPGLGARELLVTVDALLAGVPRAYVESPDAVWEDCPDPRVGAAAPWEAAALHLHLCAGLLGPPEVWQALVATVRDAVVEDAGRSLVTLIDLRMRRRVEAGLADAVPLPVEAPPAGLRPLGETSLAAWVGGWA